MLALGRVTHRRLRGAGGWLVTADAVSFWPHRPLGWCESPGAATTPCVSQYITIEASSPLGAKTEHTLTGTCVTSRIPPSAALSRLCTHGQVLKKHVPGRGQRGPCQDQRYVNGVCVFRPKRVTTGEAVIRGTAMLLLSVLYCEALNFLERLRRILCRPSPQRAYYWRVNGDFVSCV